MEVFDSNSSKIRTQRFAGSRVCSLFSTHALRQQCDRGSRYVFSSDSISMVNHDPLVSFPKAPAERPRRIVVKEWDW